MRHNLGCFGLTVSTVYAFVLPFNSLPTSPFAPYTPPPASQSNSNDESQAASRVRQYFDAWNTRDMDAAVACFSENCSYDDTQYPSAFQGRDALQRHLFRVARCLPTSFRFVVDDIADGGRKVGVRWHVESEGRPLPFTRGASFYMIDDDGLIASGFDVPEPAPLKQGDFGLEVLSLATKLIEEPIRVLPLACLVFYCYQLFLAEQQLLPGPNALRLDPATWLEVRDLSLNFWFIGPFFFPTAFPIVHPVLEGLFNIVLAWSALFAGFLADGRSPRNTGFARSVAGMQFLTNAFYLSYLVTRPSENDNAILPAARDTLSPLERLAESRLLPLLFTCVAIASLAWSLYARPDAFPDRFSSFQDIIRNDRLSASFIVDLVLYSLFQAWLVPDDLKRRGVGIDSTLASTSNDSLERTGQKYLALSTIPFFGLAAYLLVRPPLPTIADMSEG